MGRIFRRDQRWGFLLEFATAFETKGGTIYEAELSGSAGALLLTMPALAQSALMTTPTGQSYTAKLDGSDAAMKGDPGTTSVSVKMLGKDIFEETDKRNGKVIGVMKMTLAGDGKTAKVSYADALQGATTEYAAVKQ
jgi:hypothetical protein